MTETVSQRTLQSSDGSANPMSFEAGQLNLEGQPIGGTGEPLPQTLTGVEREYIWGPGDNGLDELLVQYDLDRHAWWMIQDAGGDVVAMCDLNGSSGTARVVHTWQYDAYGKCINSEQLYTNTSTYKVPQNRCGHKGLFLDRIDVGLADYSTYVDNERLTADSTAVLLYQNRNRTYSPQFGRFIQRDPNEMAQLVFEGNSNVEGGVCHPIDIEHHFADGGSSFAYLRSAPWSAQDPYGLFFNLLDLEESTTELLEFEYDHSEDVRNTGNSAKAFISGQFAALGFESYLDANWALDWDSPDAAYSNSGVTPQAFGEAPSDDSAPPSLAPNGGREPLYAGTVKPGKWKLKPDTLKLLKSSMKRKMKDGYGVYMVIEEGVVKYAGRSRHLADRAAKQLLVYGGKKAKVIGVSASKYATRGIEQAVIESYDLISDGKNIIRGISPMNKNASKYYDAMRRFLSALE